MFWYLTTIFVLGALLGYVAQKIGESIQKREDGYVIGWRILVFSWIIIGMVLCANLRITENVKEEIETIKTELAETKAVVASQVDVQKDTVVVNREIE